MHTFYSGNANYAVFDKVTALIYDNHEDPTWIALRQVKRPLVIGFIHAPSNEFPFISCTDRSGGNWYKF